MSPGALGRSMFGGGEMMVSPLTWDKVSPPGPHSGDVSPYLVEACGRWWVFSFGCLRVLDVPRSSLYTTDSLVTLSGDSYPYPLKPERFNPE